jgi:hypothetical protein
MIHSMHLDALPWIVDADDGSFAEVGAAPEHQLRHWLDAALWETRSG